MSVAMKWTWQGDAMTPADQRSRQLADQHLVVGESYRLTPHENRTGRSHNHFFACVHEAWQTMPDDMLDRFPSSEHLRKYALIKSGHCDMRTLVAASKAEAQRIAAFMAPMDGFALVVASEATVTIYTAKSMSKRAMGAKGFQNAKDDVFRVIGELIGADPAELGRAA